MGLLNFLGGNLSNVYHLQITDPNNRTAYESFLTSLIKCERDINEWLEDKDWIPTIFLQEEKKDYLNRSLIQTGEIVDVSSGMLMFNVSIFKLKVR